MCLPAGWEPLGRCSWLGFGPRTTLLAPRSCDLEVRPSGCVCPGPIFSTREMRMEGCCGGQAACLRPSVSSTEWGKKGCA